MWKEKFQLYENYISINMYIFEEKDVKRLEENIVLTVASFD